MQYFFGLLITALSLYFWTQTQNQTQHQAVIHFAVTASIIAVAFFGGRIKLTKDGVETTCNGADKTKEPPASELLKNLRARQGSKLSDDKREKIKGLLKDSIKRGQLNEFLASNNMCPSLTKLNSDRYREIGRIDEILALRALSLGLEIMLRNYCTWAEIDWPVRSPTTHERIVELSKQLILDEDAKRNYSEIFTVIQKICDSGEPIKRGEALLTCLEKSDELISDYIDWLLKAFHPTTSPKEIEDMRTLLERCQ